VEGATRNDTRDSAMSARHRGAALGVVGLLAAGLIQPAIANAATGDSAVSAVRTIAPDAFQASATSSSEVAGGREYALDRWGTTATVSADAAHPVSVSATGKPTIDVTLPFAHDARRVTSNTTASSFDNDNGTSTVVLPKDEGAVQFTTVISSASAPTSFAYGFSLPAGTHLADNGTSGSVSILDSAGHWVAGVSAPWAKDASGAPVPTHFRISGDTLTQIVDHKDGNFQYPIIADPWLGVALISRVNWTAGDQWGPTAQVYPTRAGRDTVFAPYAANEAAWGEALEKSTRSRLDHNNLHDQFTCHWQVVRFRAPNKPSWNLDSKRPDVGLARTVAAGCNPGGGKED
jgi:hypothetical protein